MMRGIDLSEIDLKKPIDEQQLLEIKNENESLRADQKFLRAVIDNAGEPIFVKDKHSKIILANESFCQMFDTAKKDVIGKTLAEKVPQNEQEHFFKIDRQVLADGIQNTCEETLTLNGGETKTIITTKTRYIDAYGECYIIGVIRDITERKKLETKLKEKADTDFLTGANNRRKFMELATLELSRATRYKNDLSMLMMDIDFFKNINDLHGHMAGDVVLSKLSEACLKNVRENDILGRIGGEEFAILLPQTCIENAIDVAENLRKLIQNLTVYYNNGSSVINFTVSIGVASVTAKVSKLEKLLHIADKALYKAKENGRNQVCS